MRRTGGLVSAIFLFLVLVLLSSIDFSNTYAPSNQRFWTLREVSPFFAGTLIEQAGSVIQRTSIGFGLAPGLTDTFLEKPVPHFAVLMALYIIFTTWFMLGITRNLKRDPSLYEVFSPSQAYVFVLYLNLILLGFFPWTHIFKGLDFVIGKQPFHSSGAVPILVEDSLLFANLWLFAILALILLRNRERARARARQLKGIASRLLATLWPAPYLVVGIALTGGAIVGLISRYRNSGFWDLRLAIYQVAFLAVWLSRDALYLQWMTLRRARRPFATAILYLVVFYGCTGVIFSALNLYDNPRSAAATGILVPSPLFLLGSSFWYQQSLLWLVALAAQAAEAAVFCVLHWMRLREFEQAPSPEPMRAGDVAQHA